MDLLSDALLREGVITEDRLLEVKSKVKGRSFILELFDNVKMDDQQIARIFSETFRVRKADLSNIFPEALEKFSEKNALKYMSIPFELKKGGQISVAMVDPLDFNSIQDIGFITGYSVIPYVATRSEILNAIQMCYQVSTDLSAVLSGAMNATDSRIEFEGAGAEESGAGLFQAGQRMEISTDEEALISPAIKLVNLLINDAYRSHSSDIHIEPSEQDVVVRLRIDGVLKVHTHIPKWMHAAVVSRIKIMSKLDISNRRTPQDGSIKLKIDNNALDLRVSTLPTQFGEKVVMRLLDSQKGGLSLQDSGLDEEELLKLRRMLVKPQGMVLITGPTGSGKTTTLHGMLKMISNEEKNIITVEDPVEYELEGITQVQVHEKAGLTFANTLRSILRQDPDVVMVGEIRDQETGEIALRASMTGHLVLSTLHTMGTAATITRLFDLGLEPQHIASSLHAIMAQRLVRVNCEKCKSEYHPDESILSLIPGIDRKTRFMRGKGCDSCNNTGYKGRTAVLEIMEVTDPVKRLISERASAADIFSLARKEGMRTLFEIALEKVYRGITTPDELLRVISVEDMTGTTCGKCGSEYAGPECPSCAAEEPSVNACRDCAAFLQEDWNYCPFCGRQKEIEEKKEGAEKQKILIVDDEGGILKMVELALRPLNAEIFKAQNGREALETAQKESPHLVITDINMPVMDGFSLIKELRSRVQTMFIPVIILSSRDSAEDKLKGFSYGTDDYITKPFDYAELQRRAEKLLKKPQEKGAGK